MLRLLLQRQQSATMNNGESNRFTGQHDFVRHVTMVLDHRNILGTLSIRNRGSVKIEHESSVYTWSIDETRRATVKR